MSSFNVDQVIESSSEEVSGQVQDVSYDSLRDITASKGVTDIAMDAKQRIIYTAILDTLRKDLKPQIEKLAQDSAKYHTLKSIYHLPSITDLKKELSVNLEERSKISMEYSEKRLAQLVQQQSNRADQIPVRSLRKAKRPKLARVQEQMRAGYNARRVLSPISEVPQVAAMNVKLAERSIISLKDGYDHSNDERDLRKIGTNELDSMFERVIGGNFPDLGRIDRLISKFEKDAGKWQVKSLDNRALKNKIPQILQEREARSFFQDQAQLSS
ncbi:DEKNAAC104481 [Brettanomyces naardenensis]|uniref:DEKNAAC104481 n=1 Tax=Brettanomyces naardenensis TaxID=13370 RepID=A0A448YR73_BRENA|nr:DEKNAAC104481 [Brettanomyces naardenensis]